jgi:hypothetical protein
VTSSLTVYPGDWFAIQADNTTVSFRYMGGGSVSDAFTGLSGYRATGGTTLPLPDPLAVDFWINQIVVDGRGPHNRRTQGTSRRARLASPLP